MPDEIGVVQLGIELSPQEVVVTMAQGGTSGSGFIKSATYYATGFGEPKSPQTTTTIDMAPVTSGGQELVLSPVQGPILESSGLASAPSGSQESVSSLARELRAGVTNIVPVSSPEGLRVFNKLHMGKSNNVYNYNTVLESSETPSKKMINVNTVRGLTSLVDVSTLRSFVAVSGEKEIFIRRQKHSWYMNPKGKWIPNVRYFVVSTSEQVMERGRSLYSKVMGFRHDGPWAWRCQWREQAMTLDSLSAPGEHVVAVGKPIPQVVAEVGISTKKAKDRIRKAEKRAAKLQLEILRNKEDWDYLSKLDLIVPRVETFSAPTPKDFLKTKPIYPKLAAPRQEMEEVPAAAGNGSRNFLNSVRNLVGNSNGNSPPEEPRAGFFQGVADGPEAMNNLRMEVQAMRNLMEHGGIPLNFGDALDRLDLIAVRAQSTFTGAADHLASESSQWRSLVQDALGHPKQKKWGPFILRIIECTTAFGLQIGLCIRNADDPTTVMMSLSAYILQLGVPSSVIQWAEGAGMIARLADFFSRTAPTDNVPQQQNLVDYADFTEPLIRIGAVAFCSMTGTPASVARAKAIQFNSKTLSSAKSIGDAMSKVLKGGADFIMTAWTGVPHGSESFVETFEKWNREVQDTVLNPDWQREMFSDPFAIDLVKEMADQGQALASSIRSADSDVRKALSIDLSRVNSSVAAVQKMIVASQSPVAGRAEPVMLVMSGSTGVGKTSIIGALALDLFMKDPDAPRYRVPNRDFLVYSKPKTTEFYDGYQGQYVYFMDEMFQILDGQATISEIEAIFSLGNTYGPALDMAALEHKGKIMFKSKYMIGTTNRFDWSQFPVASAPALQRRVAFFVRVEVLPEFANEGKGLDSDLWFAHCGAQGGDPQRPNYARFQLTNEKGVPVGEPFNYRKLVEMMDEKRRQTERIFGLRNSGLNRQFEDFMARAGLPGPIRQSDSEDSLEHIGLAPILELVTPEPSPTSSIEVVSDPGSSSSGVGNPRTTRLPQLHPDATDTIKNRAKAVTRHCLERAYIATWTDENLDAFGKKVLTDSSYNDYTGRPLHDKENFVRTVYAWFNHQDKMVQTTNLRLKPISFKELCKAAEETGVTLPTLGQKIKSIFLVLFKDNPALTSLSILLGVAGIIVTALSVTINNLRKKKEDEPKPTLPVVKIEPTKSESSARGDWSRGASRSAKVTRVGNPRMQESFANNIVVPEPQYEGYDVLEALEPGAFGSRMEALADPELEQTIATIYNNMVEIGYYEHGGRTHITSRGIAIDEYTLLCSLHSIEELSATKGLFVQAQKFRYSIPTEMLDICTVGDRYSYNDVALVRVPCHMIFRNIRKHFATEADMMTLMNFEGELLYLGKGETVRFHGPMQSIVEAVKYDPSINIKIKEDLVATQGWIYNFPTQNGYCGSPVLIADKKYPRKIIGIHCAGDMRAGRKGAYGCIVSRDWIDECFLDLAQPTPQSDDLRPFYMDEPYHENIRVLGATPKKAKNHIPLGSTTYEPSILAPHLPWKTTRAPASLACKDLKGVLKMFKKYATEKHPVDYRKIDQIVRGIAIKWFSSPDRNRKVLTFEEALNVIEDTGALNMRSSTGFPLCLEQIKKTDLFRYDEQKQKFEFTNEDFREGLDELDTRLKAGDVEEPIFLVYIKDELLPAEKVHNEGKVRVFASCPVALTLLFRKYFGTFTNHIMATKFDTGIMIGIDAHTEFGELYRRLKGQSPEVLGFDFEWWDGTVPTVFLQMYFRLASYFYSDNNQPQRNLLEKMVLNATYQLKDIRYKALTGHPSGGPMGSMINSFANMGIVIYCWLRQGISISDCLDRSFIATYGDDGCVAAKFDFSIPEFIQCARDLGLRPTSCDKDKDATIRMVPTEEAVFLKRNFYKDQYGQVHGALAMNSIKEMLLWSQSSHDGRFLAESLARVAVIELAHHDPVVARPIYIALVEACYKVSISVPMSEHMIDSIMTRQEGIDGSWIQRVLFGVLNLVWTHSLVYKKIPFPVALIPEDEEIDCLYVGIDIGKRIPGMPNGVIYHTNFQINGENMTFSDSGVVTIPKFSEDFAHPVRLRRSVLLAEMRTKYRYHRLRFNCICWAEKVLRASGQKTYGYQARLARWFQEHHPRMFNRQEMDSLGEQLFQPVAEIGQQTFQAPRVGMDSVMIQERSLHQLFAAPQIVSRFNWGVENTGYVLARIPIPGVFIKSPQFFSKLQKHNFLRATAEITIKMSSTRFHSGKLLGWWMPMATTKLPGDGGVHPFAATSMPHIRIDAAEEELKVFRVPYVHGKNYISPMVRGKESEGLGVFFIVVLSPLGGSNGSKVPVTVMANLTNIELGVPTPLDVRNYRWSMIDSKPRVAKQESDTVSDEAQVKSEKGMISGVAGLVSGAASMIAQVPILSGVGSAIKSTSDAVGTIAQALGFSKPASQASTMAIIARPFTCAAMREGLDMSIPLSLTVKNAVGISTSHFGCQADELNINYYCKTPQVINRFEWKESDEVNRTLWHVPVTPTLAYPVSPDTYQLAPVGYTGLATEFWRGSIRFGLEFVGSQIHKGALVITFVPSGAVPPNKEPQLESTSHIIWDVSQVRSIEFTIPYTSPQMFHRVPSPDSEIKMGSNYATGTIQIQVYNTLVAPEMVSKVVSVLCWISAGQDFELALPSLRKIQQYRYKKSGSVILLGPGLKSIVGSRMEGMGVEGEAMRDRGAAQLGEDICTLPNLVTQLYDVADIAMGEKIYSIRDFLKITQHRLDTVVEIDSRSSKCFEVPMVGFQAGQLTAGTFDTYFDHFLRTFRFARGSVRHKWVFTSADVAISAEVSTDVSAPYLWRTCTPSNQSLWALCCPKINPTLEYSLPFYSERRMHIVGAETDTRGARLVIQNLSSEKVVIIAKLYEAIGDDFSAGYMLGPPELFTGDNQMAELISELIRYAGSLQNQNFMVDGYYTIKAIQGKGEIDCSGSGTGRLTGNIWAQPAYYTSSMPSKAMYIYRSRVNTTQSTLIYETDYTGVNTTFFVIEFDPIEFDPVTKHQVDLKGLSGLPLVIHSTGEKLQVFVYQPNWAEPTPGVSMVYGPTQTLPVHDFLASRGFIARVLVSLPL